MVWDLRGALLKKEEFESARLIAFEFRQRARTMRLLAPRIAPDLSADALVGEIALSDDEAILRKLAVAYPQIGEETLQAAYLQCREESRVQLIAEIGDPTPHRFA